MLDYIDASLSEPAGALADLIGRRFLFALLDLVHPLTLLSDVVAK